MAQENVLPLFMKQLDAMLRSKDATDSMTFNIPGMVGTVNVDRMQVYQRRQLKRAFIEILMALGYSVTQDPKYDAKIKVFFGVKFL